LVVYLFVVFSIQVTVDHSQKILHATQGFPGSVTDQSITLLDPICDAVKTDAAFTEFEFNICTGDEDEPIQTVKGPWLMVDGGYKLARSVLVLIILSVLCIL